MPLITAADLGIPAFRPRFPWWGGDLQTLRNTFRYTEPDLSPYPAIRLSFDLADGTGDRMLALYNRPATSNANPAVVLIHGLTGSENSRNIKRSASFYLSRGYPVIRLNLRGAGPSADTCRQHYHAGRSDDLGMVIDLLPREVKDHGLFLVGTSLGGNILLKFLAESGPRSEVIAAAAVSPPIDLKAAQLQIMAPRNALYHRHLLRHMKSGLAVKTPDHVLARIGTVYDFDDLVVAPANGFSSAEDYYARCSSASLLHRIHSSTLVIQPVDDPWIPIGPIKRASAGIAALHFLFPGSGGHIGFHDAGDHWPWHNRAILAFFEGRKVRRVAVVQHPSE